MEHRDSRSIYCSTTCKNVDAKRRHATRISQHREATREEKRKRSRQYYRENKEARLAVGAAWRAANPDYFRDYYKANAEEKRRKTREYAEANPDRFARYRAENSHKFREYERRRRAITLGNDAEKIDYLAVFARDEWTCKLCWEKIDMQLPYTRSDGSREPMYPSVDHIVPLSRGGAHRLFNVQAAHLLCNVKKNAALPDETYEPHQTLSNKTSPPRPGAA